MADPKIPLSDLPAGVPGAFDKVAGVDTATGDARLFDAGSLPVQEEVENRLNALEEVDARLDGDLVGRLQDSTAQGRSYFIKDNGRDYFGLGQVQNGGRATEWEFTNDADGFTRVKYGYFGVVRDPSATVQASNVRNASGTPVDIGTILGSGDNKFFSSAQVGYKFDIEFNGRGLIFRYYADNRGGLWKITVDGIIERTVSTWAAGAGVSDNFFTVVDGLAAGAHTAVFEFMGADPDNPPASGGPRGWFKYDDGSAPTQTTGLVISGDEMAMKPVGRTIGVTNILEFAIRATADGSGIPMSWIPTHGSQSGTVVVTSKRIFINGVERLISLADLPTSEIEVMSFLLAQEYTAYSHFDTSRTFPLWAGRVSHSYQDGALTIVNDITFLRAVAVQDGYFGMASARVSDMDRVEMDNRYSKSLVTGAVETASEPGWAKSARFFDSSNPYSLAVSVASVAESTNDGAAYKDPGALTLLTERTDGFAKLYWRAIGSNKVVPSGTRLRSSHTLYLANGSH